MSIDNALLERVRKLLAKAEDPGVTAPEAQALTAKAAELMAKYGIERALLDATRPHERALRNVERIAKDRATGV